MVAIPISAVFLPRTALFSNDKMCCFGAHGKRTRSPAQKTRAKMVAVVGTQMIVQSHGLGTGRPSKGQSVALA